MKRCWNCGCLRIGIYCSVCGRAQRTAPVVRTATSEAVRPSRDAIYIWTFLFFAFTILWAIVFYLVK